MVISSASVGTYGAKNVSAPCASAVRCFAACPRVATKAESGSRPNQLSTRSQAFRTRWAAHDVKAHRAGTKVFRQPLIGEVTLPFESLTVDAAGDQVLTVVTPQPGSPEHDAIQLLASWNAHSPNPAEAESSSRFRC